MKHSIVKKIMAAAILAFLLCMILNGIIAYSQTDDIDDSVVRLHIIANSDSQKDQELKFKVRDAVLRYAKEIFNESHSKQEAQVVINANLENINQAAKDEIAAQGYDYPVQTKLEKVYFPTRQYDTFTLPAGEYDALRVIIGSGEGKNWWCVMFPPLCTVGIANDEALAYFKENLNDRDYLLVTEPEENPKIEFRFKIVELFNETKHRFNW